MILVTGGAGFIGSNLVAALNAANIRDIVVVDRLRKNQKWQNLLNKNFSEYIHADDLFLEENRSLFTKLSAIIHMGACSDTTETDVDYLMKNNYQYSQRLWQKACEYRLQFIYASSAATYGDGKWGYDDDHASLPKLRPLNPYGMSKHLFDQWVLCQKHRPPQWFGLKFFNVFGPFEEHKGKMQSVVFQAYQQVLEKGEVSLFKSYKKEFADGEQLRDFVYVKDVARAILHLLDFNLNLNLNQQNNLRNGIYNMGTGGAQSFNQLVQATFQAIQRSPKIKYIDMPESLIRQYQYYTQAEMGKWQTLFPNFRFSTLQESVEDYVVNYLNTRNP